MRKYPTNCRILPPAVVVARVREVWLMGAERGPSGRARLRAKLSRAAGLSGCLAWAFCLRCKRRHRIEGGSDAMVLGFAARRLMPAALAAAALICAGPAPAAEYGHPVPWQIDFQLAASPIMETIHSFHTFLTVLSTLIALFVLVLLAIVMLRFNERANPTPSRTTHNTVLEVAWTVVPALILVAIAIPSFRLLYDQLEIPKSDLTVKATGTAQWTWTYSYPDHGDFSFDSLMLQDKERKPDQPRLLAVDNEMVVPVNKVVRMQITAQGIIHAFAVPSFGIKVDAIPGRLNETWFKATREGIYYGQCSELCGINHAFMPIAVRVVSEQAFAAWVEEAKKKYAAAPDEKSVVVAAARDRAARETE
jgi:cytochrome c oxidase subunit 2